MGLVYFNETFSGYVNLRHGLYLYKVPDLAAGLQWL